ncbi:dihydrolipoyl dehydrogenase [uncultured Ferrovibrio sp.]|jgi:dihydrolipoamide dehydrogenase|uniref:dihydrolipoyl dehydrogenase n=1 Tax=uncultured Ferrovibrio sp. TaxID=1576913 RepID=UPI00260A331F|nr:dihydrolipoyl dehydrogenase [uncultured Ferrovibrio sp.]
MSEQAFDIIIIGAGPGGYTMAIRCAQLGMKTAVVEKRATLGGTCLNVGCIPSKALLQSSELFNEAGHGFATHGIKVGKLELDLPAMMKQKQSVVDASTKGIEFLFKKNKITWLKGAGKLLGGGKVEVKGESAGTYSAKHIVIATGSDVMPLKGIEIDEKQIVSSTGALELGKVPKTMVVIGGGVIGLELGSVWSRLGAEVTVVEFLDRILPTNDGEVSKQMQRILSKQGMKFKLSTKVASAKAGKSGVTLTMEPAAGGAAEEMTADIVLVSIGRRPYADALGLEAAGVQLDERGRIKTDGHFQTTAAGVYAIGDVIAGPMLAHKAEEEGVVLAEMLAGQKPHINYDAIPAVVYTWPEVASVGKTEEELKAAGIAYKAGKFPFTANARARAMTMTDGFVKILEDEKTKRVVGCHIIGPDAGHLIQEVVMAIEFGASAEDIYRTCHAHPALTEAVKEAALAVDGRTINI